MGGVRGLLTVALALVLVVSMSGTGAADTLGRGAQPYVVNGKYVDPATYAAQWPATVSLSVPVGGRVYRCGGTLITSEVVITAAHCLRDGSSSAWGPAIRVRGGSADIGTPGFEVVGVTEYWTHPGFVPGAPPNGPVGGDDVALLRLSSPAPASPAALAAPGEVPSAGIAYVAGWGVSRLGTSPDNLLREAAVPARPADYCNLGDGVEDGYGAGMVDPQLQVCAGQFTRRQGGAPDTCQGDSGGPLMVRDRGGARLVGVTSYGSGCGVYPAVYSAVGGYRSVIEGRLAAWGLSLPPPPAPSSADGTFVPLPPARLLDTRDADVPLAPGEVRAIPVLGAHGVPGAGVSAVALNVTVAEPAAAGYLTLFPCDQAVPLASNLNYERGEIVANGVAVGVGQGAVCAVSYAAAHLVVDVGGYWLADGTGAPAARYQPVAPQRWIDTRVLPEPLIAGEVYAVDMGDLSGTLMSAVTVNVTVADPSEDGYVTVFPCDSPPPLASNVNYTAGEIVANAATVALDTNERLCVTSYATTDVILDATGWFGVPGSPLGGRLRSVPPARLIDTRTGPTPPAGSVQVIPVAGQFGVPADATAAIVTVTAVDPLADGYLSAYPCGQAVPETSTVNHLAGPDIANLAFVPIGADGTICVFTYAPAHTVVDITAYTGS